jgi:amidophosphoribosyltransferase
VYGIDMPAASELVAAGHSNKEIEAMLGADWLIYQDLQDLIWAVQDGNENLKHFDTSCFSGEYVTGLDQHYLQQIEMLRSDDAKAARRSA